MKQPRVLGVIPARLAAQRLPDKPLRLLGGRPLIERVARNAQRSGAFTQVVVATDAESIARVVREAGLAVVMTAADHVSGTSRVAEVARLPQFGGFDVIVNVQGDEPFLSPRAVAGSIGRVAEGFDIGTAAVPLEAKAAQAPGVVKVVFDAKGRALYFSRSPIPYARDGGPATYWQHLGVYAFTSESLQAMVALPPSELEETEKLEQLRALANGISIGVAAIREAALPGIDTAEDLERAETFLAAHGETFTASEA